MTASTAWRVGLFVAVCVGCAVVAIGYGVAASRDGGARTVIADEGDIADGPHLLFRDTAGGSDYGRAAVSDLADPGGPRALADLRCDRVHMAAHVGMCLRAHLGVIPTYEAMIFDDSFTVRHRFDIAGQPSRTQVSPDGRLAAYTVFVTGHSYADGAFSTRTAIVDTETATELVELEQLTVLRDGEPFNREDFNFWGVTFTDDANRFYATLATGDELLLIEGDVARRQATVIADDVECPSLAPDGTRVAYKERHVDTFGLVSWTIAVLDLRTMQRTTLAETRNVDDQVEWLDDATVMYGLDDAASFAPQTDVWTVPADGSGAPALLVEAAWSPVPVR